MRYVLYAFNENYAPFAGVSICSLLENNSALPFSLIAVTEQVCEDTKAALQALVARYGREICFVDVSAVQQRLRDAGIPAYRDALSANVRLFPECVVPTDAERVLYLDCDTLICGSLQALFDTDLGGAPVGAVRDSLTARYKRLLGFAKDEPYFNSGVLLLDMAAWRAARVTLRIEQHAREVRAQYQCPDQDLLNLVLKGEITTLSPAYNLQPHHIAFSERTYLHVYGAEGYYTASELESARRSPVILHAYRFLGDFPWHAKNRHPNTQQWDAYLAKTPWNGIKKAPAKRGAAFTLEKLLYRVLPKRLFLSLFATVTYRKAKKAEKQLQK